jgi:F-type H+-transporting ATPase subunit a
MVSGRVKSLLVAGFSLLITSFFNTSFAQPHEGEHQPSGHEAGAGEAKEEKKGFNASEIIFGHVLNAHEFHFLDIGDHPVTIPLPVILYSPQRGMTSFMSSGFEHGHKVHKGYMLLTDESIVHHGLDPKKYNAQDIVAVNEAGEIDPSIKVYDISLTRNVVQMLIALFLFTWVMLRIAKRYKSGVGVTSAPKGSQSLLEPVITFIRDEVARPNLGKKADKYLPFILTVFFFILINNLVGLIPGSANVTGNIAFTVTLGVISFIVILASSNKHYWGHISILRVFRLE